MLSGIKMVDGIINGRVWLVHLIILRILSTINADSVTTTIHRQERTKTTGRGYNYHGCRRGGRRCAL